MTTAVSVESRIQAYGREIFARLGGRPLPLTRRFWDDWIMSFAMSNDALKVQLFRFVDTLPYLHDPNEVGRHLREYLTIVRALLADGKLAHQGERYQVQGMLDVEGGGTPPVMLSALREQMCRLAGAHADGVLPWLPSPDYIADVVVPNVAMGAASANRAMPPVIAEFPAALTTDSDELAQICATDLMIYPMMPFYRAMWEHAGIEIGDRKVAGGWSRPMIDASIAHGDEHALATRIDAYFAAGADEVIVSPMGTNDAQRDDCLRVLADIAKG